MQLHSSLGNRARFHLEKIKKKTLKLFQCTTTFGMPGLMRYTNDPEDFKAGPTVPSHHKISPNKTISSWSGIDYNTFITLVSQVAFQTVCAIDRFSNVVPVSGEALDEIDFMSSNLLVFMATVFIKAVQDGTIHRQIVKSDIIHMTPEKVHFGQTRWLTPVIPALWEAKVSRSLEASSSRPARPTWQNLVFTKNTKISWAWWHL
ncbi:putative uncharacterized protein C8orf44 [Plecturocebus cupreus]